MPVIHIRRRFAVWNEDCIETVLPDDIDPNDKDAVETWARENYDDLSHRAMELAHYGEDTPHFGIEDTGTKFLWEDKFVTDIDSIDDEYIVEAPS